MRSLFNCELTHVFCTASFDCFELTSFDEETVGERGNLVVEGMCLTKK